MRIDIRGDKLQITPSTRAYIEEKIGALARYVKRFERKGELTVFVELAHVTTHHQHGEVFFAGASVRVPGKLLKVKHFDEGVRVAVDALRDKLKALISKYKDKKESVRDARE